MLTRDSTELTDPGVVPSLAERWSHHTGGTHIKWSHAAGGRQLGRFEDAQVCLQTSQPHLLDHRRAFTEYQASKTITALTVALRTKRDPPRRLRYTEAPTTQTVATKMRMRVLDNIQDAFRKFATRPQIDDTKKQRQQSDNHIGSPAHGSFPTESVGRRLPVRRQRLMCMATPVATDRENVKNMNSAT